MLTTLVLECSHRFIIRCPGQYSHTGLVDRAQKLTDSIRNFLPPLFIFMFWLFICLGCANAHHLLTCFREDVFNWTVSVQDQMELDTFMEQAAVPINGNTSRCIQLSLTEGIHYRLNIVKMMQIHLGTAGGLIIAGTNGRVKIDCIASVPDMEELKRLLKPISSTSLVVFDGLTFVKCPVPILIKEVSLIVVQNCEFT